MIHQRADRGGAAAEPRSLTEILADARASQGRHAPRVFGAAASWIRWPSPARAEGRSSLAARHLVVH